MQGAIKQKKIDWTFFIVDFDFLKKVTHPRRGALSSLMPYLRGSSSPGRAHDLYLTCFYVIRGVHRCIYLFLRWLGMVPSASTIDVPTFAPQLSGESQSQMSSSSTAPVSSNKAPSFDPIAGILAQLVKHILEFKFVDML